MAGGMAGGLAGGLASVAGEGAWAVPAAIFESQKVASRPHFLGRSKTPHFLGPDTFEQSQKVWSFDLGHGNRGKSHGGVCSWGTGGRVRGVDGPVPCVGDLSESSCSCQQSTSFRWDNGASPTASPPIA